MLEYPNRKTLLQKVMFQIDLKKCFCFKKLKLMCRVHIFLVILMVKKLLERFTKKNYKKQINKS